MLATATCNVSWVLVVAADDPLPWHLTETKAGNAGGRHQCNDSARAPLKLLARLVECERLLLAAGSGGLCL